MTNETIQVNDYENKRSLNIIGVPDYILRAFNSKGTDFNKFVNEIEALIIKDNKETNLLNYFKENLSKYDVSDFLVFNSILEDNLELPVLFNSEIVKNIVRPDELVDANARIINLYNNDTINIENIIMSKINNNNKLPFSLKSSNNCLFIIPQSGFTNFIVKNVKEFKLFTLNVILIWLKNNFGDELTYSNKLFKTFGRLVYTK